ncbi:Protein of uncharacterised function (DUF2510) [Mycobacteroides abscessus subsp. abscessus]|uniref:DUF2510 domain-containing protein n=1 Tax=Mycobacteroides abscessus TaxID=36809 RepID=UPI00092A0844|nr:DUF2510 domain-containing protein [Mycobacteroides abscessus]SHT35868.1 Protein of uncharacterised function (DUF2510) [Mycobacteroides abscessus subsp. abscessus]SHU45231.1 Protein of uncharacterised function (DUF2510) [Mycobacteroides abscessus subsp. abscessus]
MTTQPPPPPPPGWYPDPSGKSGQRYFDGTKWTVTQAPAGKQKSNTGWWIAGGVFGGLLLLFGGCTALIAIGSQSPTDRPVGPNQRTQAAAPQVTTHTTPTVAAAMPTPADFTISVVILEQKCFGSAGCNYRYTIDPKYTGRLPLASNVTVVYSLSGGDSDEVGNFTVDRQGTATVDKKESISGPQGAELVATATRVMPAG